MSERITRRLDCDGLQVSWHERGAGTPIVFQHGLCGDFGQVDEAVPDAGVQLMGLECRGHGASAIGPYANLSLARFAADIETMLDRLAPGPIVVGGISMGAALAMRLAILRPDLVRGLVLVRPAWADTSSPEHLAPNREVAQLLKEHGAPEAAARFARSDTYRRLTAEAPDNLKSLLGFFSRQPLADTAALLSAIAADGTGVTSAQIGAIAVPTLVIGTDRDALHPLALAHQLAETIPGARFALARPKAVDKQAHIADLHAAIGAFIKDHAL